MPTLTWVGSLAGADAWVALVVNNEPGPRTLSFDVGLLPRPQSAAKLAVRDVWDRQDLGTHGEGDTIAKSVGGHDCLLLRFAAAK